MFERNLKFYRLKKNMTKKELAQKVGVTPMAITNYESGKRRPDMSTITKLADVLGVYVSDFLAMRNSELKFSHHEFRKNISLTKMQEEKVTESVEEYLSRFFDAVECLGGSPLPPPFECHTVSPSEDYEADAILLRKAVGIREKGPVGDLFSILEYCGIIVFEIDIDSGNFSGMNGMVNDYPYIVINRNITPERKRTTILHELAHMVFSWSEDDEKAIEKKATAAAGAALITREDLFCELGPRRSTLTKDMVVVAEKYGISMYLLVKRARQAGIITDSLEKEFYIIANSAEWRKNEPRRVLADYRPHLLEWLVLRAVNEGEINIVRGSELLAVTVPEMRKYCGPLEV